MPVFRLGFRIAATIHRLLSRTPINRIIAFTRTREGHKWGVPVMLLAIPCLVVATTCSVIARDGGPGWLHIVVLIAFWDACKLTWTGPVSLVLLARARFARTRTTLA